MPPPPPLENNDYKMFLLYYQKVLKKNKKQNVLSFHRDIFPERFSADVCVKMFFHFLLPPRKT